MNAFAHVNHSHKLPHIGTLLCVNGTGIANSWIKKYASLAGDASYEQMNALASNVHSSEGLKFLPFGNGTERMLGNKLVQSHLSGLDFNRHNAGHLIRSVQEGIVFALNYGTEIMKANGLKPNTIKAGKANMFLSPLFRQMFSSLLNVPLEFYDTDGATGAARGAGIGFGHYSFENAFTHLHKIEEIIPDQKEHQILSEQYQKWNAYLDFMLSSIK